ncbi:UNVERIFIED_CONTAM: hypothetical protein HDU68_001949 [Siphonaria sp. JEL0065]|nr:hypothetical protein HDU68_001949 [Siphonaria sp. JEL0065]
MKFLTVLATLSSLSLALRPNVSGSGLEFRDVNAKLRAPPSPITLPEGPTFQSVVNPLLTNVDQGQITMWMTRLTQFPERHYKSQNGVAAANWIMSTVQGLPVPSGAKLTVYLYKHANFIQPSVIARFEPATPNGSRGIVITGSHFDTAAYGSPQGPGGPNPAADDCASGSVAVYEALRVLTTSGFIPGRPIEFHWYAGEEFGLLGSHDIANSYAAKGIEVVSYLNLDQSGYIKPGTKEQIGIYVDYTTPAATTLLSATVAAYAGLPQIGGQKCGYECTDNAAWFDAGYNSAMAFESTDADGFTGADKVNSDGTFLDTLAVVSVPHVAAFAKSTIGFIVELSLAGSTRPASTTITTTTIVKQSTNKAVSSTATTTTKPANSTSKPTSSTTTTTTKKVTTTAGSSGGPVVGQPCTGVSQCLNGITYFCQQTNPPTWAVWYTGGC